MKKEKSESFRENSHHHEINCIFEKINSTLARETYYYPQYEDSALALRLTQIIGRMSLKGFFRRINGSLTKGNSNIFYSDGIFINENNHSVKPSKTKLLSCISVFLLRWIFTLTVFFLSFLKTRPSEHNKSAVLIYGAVIPDLTDPENQKRFRDFCQNGPLPELHEANQIFFKSNLYSEQSDNSTIFSRSPLMSKLIMNSYTSKDTRMFLSIHLRNFFLFFVSVVKHPISCLLCRDIAEDAALGLLNDRNLIISIIITNSNWLEQKLWMSSRKNRNFKLSLALYSLNFFPFVLKSKKYCLGDKGFFPGMDLIQTDEILSWGDICTQELKKIGINCSYRNVGPVLWHIPNRLPKTENNKLKIAIFDVPPFKIDAILDHGDVQEYYYNTDTVIEFMKTSIACAKSYALDKQMELEIYYKPKRDFHPAYDERYSDFIEALVLNESSVTQQDTSKNLFDLINATDVIICIPFSSPAYIAAFIGKKAIYYDPTADLVFESMLEGVLFCNSCAGLEAQLKETLASCI